MFKNLKIGKKLVISFILVAVISSAAGIFAAFQMNSVDEDYSEALVNDGFSQGDLGIALTLYTDSRRTLRDMLLFREDAEKYADAAQRLEQIIVDYSEYLALVEPTLDTPAQQAMYDQIQQDLPAYRDVRAKIVDLVETGDEKDVATAYTVMTDELDPKYTDIYDEMSQLMMMKQQKGEEINVSLSQSSQQTLIIVIVVIAVALIVAIVFGVLMSRSITIPITACVKRLGKAVYDGDMSSEVKIFKTKDETGELSQATADLVGGVSGLLGDQSRVMAGMAAGDFTVALSPDVPYIGDFVELRRSIEVIIGSMNEVLGRINTATDQVAIGADQVSNGAQALSQGATEQAGAVQELAATITEIAQGSKDNAQTATNANRAVGQVSTEIMQSSEKMEEMVKAMENISETSSEIGKIIKTIEDIAFQTNILALNAAVEAARAGNAGQGFAVVADEVRNLASKSSEASKNSAALIEQSIRAVQEGSAIAQETAQALSSVVGGAREITENMSTISEASTAQSTAVEQIRLGIDQIAVVVQTNSATSEESAAASEELSGQAQMMKGLVGKFRLKNVEYKSEGDDMAEPSDAGFDDGDIKY